MINNICKFLGYVLVAVFVFSIFYIFGNEKIDVRVDTYNLYNVGNINIELGKTELSILNSNEFKLEISKNVKYEVKNNTLYITDKRSIAKQKATLYIPYGKNFDDVSIKVGIASILVDDLSANKVKLKMGSSSTTFNKLTVVDTLDIDGGVGKLAIDNANINKLNFKGGIGNIKFKGVILSNASMKMGIGNIDMELMDAKDNYRFAVDKGIGSIDIFGESVRGNYLNGNTLIEIDGGIGNVNIH